MKALMNRGRKATGSAASQRSTSNSKLASSILWGKLTLWRSGAIGARKYHRHHTNLPIANLLKKEGHVPSQNAALSRRLFKREQGCLSGSFGRVKRPDGRG